MVFLEELLAPLAALLHVPIGALVFAALMVMGVVGHYAIYRIVRRLTKAADRTETQWDDVLRYAIFHSPSTALGWNARAVGRRSSKNSR